MRMLNDNSTNLDQYGNLTLGLHCDDGSADGTHKYAKADIFVPIPLMSLMIAETTTSDLIIGIGQTDAVTAETDGDVGMVPLLTMDEASKAYKVLATLQPPVGFRRLSSVVDPYGITRATPHGAKLLDVTFTYRPVTAAISNFACLFFTETMATSAASGAATGAARATQVPYGGTVLYEQPVGTACTAANLKVDAPTTAANFYTVKAKPTTPAFINDDYTSLYFQIAATTGAGNLEIGQMIAHWSVALY
jgi:hypothetical protein